MFCPGARFNLSQIEALKPLLERTWPDLIATDPIDTFWSHEWSKHGTCAIDEKVGIENEKDYFGLAINLNRQYRIFECDIRMRTSYECLFSRLKRRDVVSSDTKTYTLNDIRSALKASGLGVVKFECTRGVRDGAVVCR